MEKRSLSTSRLKKRWTPKGNLTPLVSHSQMESYSKINLILNDSHVSLAPSKPNRSFESPNKPSRLSSMRQVLTRDSSAFTLNPSLACSPEDLFLTILDLPSTAKERIMKNRICDDLKRITHADLLLILHRKVMAELLTHGTLLAQLTPAIISQLVSLPRLPDTLTGIISTLEQRGSNPATYQEVVLDAINKEIGLYQNSISDLHGKLGLLEKEKQALTYRIKELETHRQLDSQLSRELSQIRNSSPRRLRRSQSPEPLKVDQAGVYKRKLEAVYALLEAANSRSDSPFSDIERMNDHFAKAINGESAFLFELKPLESCFFATYKGMNYRVNCKNSLLSVALTNKETFMFCETDNGFDGRLGQQMGICIKTMIIVPVVAWGEALGVILVVNRRFETNAEKLAQAKTDVETLIHIYGMVLAQKTIEGETKRISRAFQSALESCVQTLKQTNLSQALVNLGQFVTEIIDAERAHVLFCDSLKREIFYREEIQNASDTVHAFPSQKGIAGYCAHTRQTLAFSDLRTDKLFCKEIDDPGDGEAQTALCTPLSAGKELEAQDLPYAVLVVINKKGKSEFTAKDIERLKSYGELMSCLLQAIQVRENFFALKGVLRSTVEAVSEVVSSMDSSHKYNSLKLQLSKVEEAYSRLVERNR